MSEIKNAHMQEQMEACIQDALVRALGYFSGERGWSAVGAAFGSHLHAAFPADTGWRAEVLGDCIGRTLIKMSNGDQVTYLTLDVRAEIQPALDNELPCPGFAMVP